MEILRITKKIYINIYSNTTYVYPIEISKLSYLFSVQSTHICFKSFNRNNKLSEIIILKLWAPIIIISFFGIKPQATAYLMDENVVVNCIRSVWHLSQQYFMRKTLHKINNEYKKNEKAIHVKCTILYCARYSHSVE